MKQPIRLCSARLALLAALLSAMVGGCGGDEQQLPGSQARQDPARRWNVMLIVSDAMRFDMLGCNGGPARTPNLDRLALRGTRFEQAYTSAPWTMPAAVGMMTGQPAEVFRSDESHLVEGRQTYIVPSSCTTLPQTLQSLGYSLVLNAYNPNAWLAGNFRDFQRVERDSLASPISAAEKKLLDRLARVLPLRTRSTGHRRLTGMLDFLQSQAVDEPFFAVNWFDDPHGPYHPDEKFLRPLHVPREQLPRKPQFYLNHTNMHLFDERGKESLLPVEVDFFRRLYQAEVESIDERVGLILAMLDRQGLTDQTLIIFTADHGEAFNDHGQFEHGRSYYNELVHVPLIMAGPGVPVSQVVAAPVSLLDLMAWNSELLGLQDPDAVSASRKFTDIGNQAELSHPLYFDGATALGGYDCRDAVLHEGFKLVTHLPGTASELYDTAADPAEITDLAPADQNRVAALTALLNAHREDYAHRRKAWLAASPAAADTQLDGQRQEILRKLKSLGYVN